MTLKAAQAYDSLYDRWVSATNVAWVLCTEAYTPLETHSTYANLTNVITTGDGAPIAVTTRTTVKSADELQLHSDDANFGDPVTVSAKYLVAVEGDASALVAGDTVLFFIDLRSEDGNPETSSAAPFRINKPAAGWIGFDQAAL